MKLYSTLVPVLVAGLTTAFHVATAGEITGTVTLKGTPPKELEITPLENDPTCGKMHSGKVFTEFYKVGPNHGLGDVVVMLKVSGESTGAKAPTVLLDQKGCLYHPYVFAVQTGQKIEIENSDPVLHNVHVETTVAGNPDLNQAQMPGSPPLTISFPKPENFIMFKCDVHPWMYAWATVVDSPYYAVTAKDGSFTIKNVPAGKYTIVAVHHKAGEETKEIEVKAGEPTKVDFTLTVK